MVYLLDDDVICCSYLGQSYPHFVVPCLELATLGGARTLARPWGWDLGAGGDVTFYAVPDVLRPDYGDRPVSFHVFFRIRPRQRWAG